MSYLKRQKVPRNWPIRRKGTTYVVRPNFNIGKGMPVLVILRDILKVAQTRKDVKKIIHAGQVLLNNKPVRDEKNNVLLFDILSITPTNKSYVMDLSNKGKFEVKEVCTNDAGKKVAKIINKKVYGSLLRGIGLLVYIIRSPHILIDVLFSINISFMFPSFVRP